MRKHTSRSLSTSLALILATAVPPAVAHTSDTTGFWHLITGADHLLVLLTIALVLCFLLQLFKPAK